MISGKLVKTISCIYLLTLCMIALPGFFGAPARAQSTAAGVSAEKTVVYYFHGNRRCSTCRGIEAHTREVVESDFGELLRSGRMEFKSVNLDRSENEHFVKDFQLVSRTVVLAREANGKILQWKNLDQVWLLAHQTDKFKAYIKGELEKFLQDKQ